MSSNLAIAMVTEVLRHLLQDAVDIGLPGTTVSAARPGSVPGGPAVPRIDVVLYRVSPDAVLRYADVPFRGAPGGVELRAPLALSLDYLVCVSGDEAELQPERLAGIVGRALYARPVLDRELIEDTLAHTLLPFLANSALAAQPEPVRVLPVPLSLEELADVRTAFAPAQLPLSIAYRASPVMIEPD